ncbi:MMPL family transporter [Nocardioides cheoyonin]|uniref:MMPL family transporter n=1 Tax=Nocardioides cheoyonin TaxID=3156615 RepID=UPI0032B58381
MGNPLTAVPMRAARWSARHPWRAILAWVVFVLVAVGCATAIPTKETSDADYRVGESGRADALVAKAGLEGGDSENVLLTARGGSLDLADARVASTQLRDRAGDLPEVARVGAPVVSPDRSAVLVPVELTRDADELGEIAGLRAAVAGVQHEHPDLRVREAGDVTVDAAINDRVGSDLGSAETSSLPVTLVLMLVAFGALIAAGIPVLLAATSVAATIGLLAPLSHLIPADMTTSSMIVLIGMAVGVDYSLFYLKREREERLAGRTTRDAVDIAAETSGHSILVSGGAVIAALAGLFVIDDATFNSLAAGSIVVVAVAVLGSITVLPALLVKLGRWVDRPRVPLLWRLNRRIGRGGISSRLLRPVVRRPLVAVLLAGVGIAALAVPALGMRTHSATLDTLPRDIPEVATYRAMAASFPSDSESSARVVLRTDGTPGAAQEAYDRLVREAVATGDFVAPSQPAQTSRDGRTAVLTLGLPWDEADDRTPGAIRQLRGELLPQALAGDRHVVDHAVGGDPAESLDFADKQSGRLLLVIGFVLALTMLIMVATFRSIVLGLLSTLLNLGSVGAAFGVMTLVFQHGWLEAALGFHSPGFVIDWLPLFVLVVLVGLSMDYHVFVISRVREHVDRGLPTRLAVEKGIAGSAGVVTSAAAVMVSVFAIFASLSMLEMKTMGVALAVAILLDATVVRLVLLPAALVLLGERVWWPRRRPGVRGEVVEEPEPAYAAAD